MRINTKTTNIELTSELSDYLNKRLESLQKLMPDRDESAIIDVEVGRVTKHHQSGDIFRAEINVYLGSRTFRAVRETNDLFSSIDEAKDQMMDELRSSKQKKIHLIRRGGQKIKAILKGFYWWRK